MKKANAEIKALRTSVLNMAYAALRFCNSRCRQILITPTQSPLGNYTSALDILIECMLAIRFLANFASFIA